MALTKLTKDMAIIQTLDDEPNDVGGLSAADLKAKYDEGNEAVKAFVNEVLTPELDTFMSRTDNPHAVTKAQVGLGAADNTADAEKPVSTAQASALSLKADRLNVLERNNTSAFTPTESYHPATKKYVDDVSAGVVLGQIPDGGISTAKLADGVVTAAKLADGAVTPASIGAASTSHASAHATGGSDPLTPAQIGAATTTTLTATVPVSWTASGNYYYQQVSVAGMLATDNPVADILPGSDNAANKLYAEAWAKVQSIDTQDGAVKLWCTAAPTTAFPVQFKVVR